MSRTAEPQTKRLATAALDALGMSKIIKPSRPFVIARNDESGGRRRGQPLEDIDGDPCCAVGNGFAEQTLNDLGPSTFGTQVLHQLGDCGITAVYRAAEQHPRSAIGCDHG
jgi:hypothetical protein